MKKVIILSLLGLAACGGTKTIYVEPTDAPTTTIKPARTTDAPVAQYSDEDWFLYEIEELIGETYVDDQMLIDTGYMVCEALRAGATMEMLAYLIDDNSNDADTANFLAAISASAVINFCPDQQYKFNN